MSRPTRTPVVVIDDGTLSVDASDDAIGTEGSAVVNGGALTLASGDDAVHADVSVAINGGTVDITGSYEGLESAELAIRGGETTIVASDDGINGVSATSAQAAGPGGGGAIDGSVSLTISGGTAWLDAGGDGIDIGGNVTMSGGTVVVNGPTVQGNGPLDYDGTWDQSGGVLVAVGSAGMAQAPSSTSSQLALASSFTTQSAGTPIRVTSADGQVIVSFVPTKTYESLVVSTPDIAAEVSYDVSVGGTATDIASSGLAASSTGGSVIDTTTSAEAASSGGMGGGGMGGAASGGRPGR